MAECGHLNPSGARCTLNPDHSGGHRYVAATPAEPSPEDTADDGTWRTAHLRKDPVPVPVLSTEEFVQAMDRIRKAVEEARPQVVAALQGIAGTLREIAPVLQKIVEQVPSLVTAPENPNVCPAVLHLGNWNTHACTLDAGHAGRHKDGDGDTWEITGLAPVKEPVCGAVREGERYNNYPCVRRPGHLGSHEDRGGDDF